MSIPGLHQGMNELDPMRTVEYPMTINLSFYGRSDLRSNSACCHDRVLTLITTKLNYSILTHGFRADYRIKIKETKKINISILPKS